jgi:hypothetical protein
MFGKIKCMFTRKKKVNNLEELISYTEGQLIITDECSKDYQTMLRNLERFHKLRADKRTWKVKPDTIWQVGASLGGIIMILGFEKANVLTSKAVNFVLRGRV